MVQTSSRRTLRSKYRVLGLIGQGQFGRVYCATHRKTGEIVALKSLDHARFPTHQFLRELRFLLSLRHPNIVACRTLEHTSKGRCLVMDYCEGGTLRHLLEGGWNLSLRQIFHLIRDILAGLSHAETQAIIHCDIKPENILLVLSSEGWTAKITDFGIARFGQDLKIGTGTTGSPAYMAPERFYGQYHTSTDLYAVGILLFEFLVGSRPFSGTPQELMDAHLNTIPKIPETVPASLRPILSKSLQKLPARRFQSAKDMLQALQAAIETLEAQLIQLNFRHVWNTPPAPVAFEAVWHVPLSTPVTRLALVKAEHDGGKLLEKEVTDLPPPRELLYHSSSNQVRCALYGGGILTDRNPQIFQREFDLTVCDLVTTPAGCFIVTPHHIYRWHFQANQGSSLNLLVPAPITCVQEFDTSVQAVIAVNGQWFAAASHPPGLSSVQIVVGKLQSCANLSPPIDCRSPSLSQLIMLDPGHGLVIGQEQTHTVLELFNRRGHWLGCLPLGVMLERCASGIQPYQLIGLEVGYPNALLVVDLKPLRIRRLSLPIEPACFTAMPWGYVVADTQAQILLLDREGDVLGWIRSPLETTRSGKVTALTTLGNHGLLLATWEGKTGNLWAIDLRQLEIDLLF